MKFTVAIFAKAEGASTTYNSTTYFKTEATNAYEAVANASTSSAVAVDPLNVVSIVATKDLEQS